MFANVRIARVARGCSRKSGWSATKLRRKQVGCDRRFDGLRTGIRQLKA